MPDEEAALALRDRLRTDGVQMGEIGDPGTMRNFVFQDNNHLMLEAIWLKA